MDFTGERYLPEIYGAIALEHKHRYLIACQYAQGKTVLDIASGEGYGSAMLSQVAQSVIGVDISEEAIAHAAEKYTAENLEFRLGNAAAIPLPDASVDMVVSFETIEHHTQHEEMLQEIKRVLRPGGLLYMSSPDKTYYTDVPHFQNEYHVKELTGEEFTTLITKYFKNVALSGQRVLYGSVIGSEDQSSFLSWNIEQDKAPIHGTKEPLYRMALASDQALPEAASGVLEYTLRSNIDETVNVDKWLYLNWKHVQNVEAVLKKTEEHTQNLEQHVRNLEAVITDREEHISSLGKHTENLEQHAHNLESVIQDKAQQLCNVKQHAHNLELLIAEKEQLRKNAEVHSAHLATVLLHTEHELQSLHAKQMHHDALVASLPQWKKVLLSIALCGIRFTAQKVVAKLTGKKGQQAGALCEQCSCSELEPFVLNINSENQKRIVLVSHDMRLGGAPLALYNLAKELQIGHGYQVQVITLQDGPRVIDFTVLGCQVHLLNCCFSYTEELPQRVKDLVAELAQQGFDRVVANTTISGALTALFKEHNMRVVTLVHEMPDLMQQMDILENARQLAVHSDAVVFGGRTARDQFPFLDSIEPESCVLLGQGSTMPLYDGERESAHKELLTRLSLPDDAFVVLGCGLGEPRKGTDFFADTLVEVARTHENIFFVWIGSFVVDNFQKKILDILQANNLQERFIDVPFTKQLAPYLIGADLFFLCSREDPFPTVVLDAMRSGLPCLTFAGNGGAEEMLGEGRGLIVPLCAIPAAAEAIIAFSGKTPQERIRFSVEAQNYATEFTPERYATEILSLFEKMPPSVPACETHTDTEAAS